MNAHKAKHIRRLAENTVNLWPKEHSLTAFISPPDTFFSKAIGRNENTNEMVTVPCPYPAKASPYRRLVKQLKREHKN